MRFASIDLGTNSTRLLIADVEGRRIRPLVREMHITRLGRNLSAKKIIGAESRQETIHVLSAYMEKIRKHDVGLIKAVGTAALRKAKNKDAFLALVSEKTGLQVDIISSQEEARYSFKGASADLGSCPLYHGQKVLLMDIGGGSSELIGGHAHMRDLFFQSLDMGCVTLTEAFFRSDPPKEEEVCRLGTHIRKTLARHLDARKAKEDFLLIGVAGTVAAIASMQKGLAQYDREQIHHSVLTRKNIQVICEKLITSSLEERKKIPGLEEKRADIIAAGTVLLLELMRFFQREKILVSESDILDGIVYSIAKI